MSPDKDPVGVADLCSMSSNLTARTASTLGIETGDDCEPLQEQMKRKHADRMKGSEMI